MVGCNKEYRSNNSLTYCGKKVYRDGKCFPHWARWVPKWYLRQLDSDFIHAVVHSPFHHRCPQGGHNCPYRPQRNYGKKETPEARELRLSGLSTNRAVKSEHHGRVSKESVTNGS